MWYYEVSQNINDYDCCVDFLFRLGITLKCKTIAMNGKNFLLIQFYIVVMWFLGSIDGLDWISTRQ